MQGPLSSCRSATSLSLVGNSGSVGNFTAMLECRVAPTAITGWYSQWFSVKVPLQSNLSELKSHWSHILTNCVLCPIVKLGTEKLNWDSPNLTLKVRALRNVPRGKSRWIVESVLPPLSGGGGGCQIQSSGIVAFLRVYPKLRSSVWDITKFPILKWKMDRAFSG